MSFDARNVDFFDDVCYNEGRGLKKQLWYGVHCNDYSGIYGFVNPNHHLED